MKLPLWLKALVLVAPALALVAFGPRGQTEIPAGRVVVTYWEKWTLDEGRAIKTIVSRFNETVGRDKGVWVNYTALGDVDKRMLIATAGGDPPDIAGLSDRFVPQYADQDALLPLDNMMAEHGIDAGAFKPIWLDICRYRGKLYALPSTPFTIALFYNRAHFRAAGLDPDRPPQTTAEFTEYAVKLTRFETGGAKAAGRDDRIVQLGFTPSPSMLGWWHWVWPGFFGGRLWDGERFHIDDEPGRAAYEWLMDYRNRVGNRAVVQFEGQGSVIESAQNPFLAGRLSMVFQGPWFTKWAMRYAPELDYGVAPFPSSDPARKHVLASCDVFVIPRSAKHPREAMMFLSYLMSQPVLEELNREHGKVSPFRSPLPSFYEGHPNPHVRIFDEMATSADCFGYPQMPTWGEAWTETLFMTENTLRGVRPPADEVRDAQLRVDAIVAQYDRAAARRKARQ
ncbi:MAG: ABC transporter substrate-binding protein [Phycisphaerae bacterium]|nr:ABC transporter substrate-binding protein [Phycisphaerae bacterium]